MKRCICILLTLVMLLSLVPLTAFAKEKPADIIMTVSEEMTEKIKKYEGCVLTAYQDAVGVWTIGYGHTQYVPCKDAYVEEGMEITQEEADEMLLNDLNEVYAPSVNDFVNSHRDVYPDGFTQNEFDVLTSMAFGFGTHWIDWYTSGQYAGDKAWRLASYLKEGGKGIFNHSDAEIADAIVCLWSNLNGLLYRRVDEARIFLYGDYDGTGEHQIVYTKFLGATPIFKETKRSGNVVAAYIKGCSYGELPTAADSKEHGYFVGWQTSDGKLLKNSDIASESLTVSAVWSETKPEKPTEYSLSVVGGTGSGDYAPGSTVRIAPSPRSEDPFYGWTGIVTPIKNSDGTYSVIMPACDLTLQAKYVPTDCIYKPEECPSKDFDDVAPDFWAHVEIDFALENGIFKGLTETSFAPNANMNRGMLVTVLYRIAGSKSVAGIENPFTDLPNNAYHDAILWASHNRIANGFEDGTFRSTDPLTREQLATFLNRFANYLGGDTDYDDHADLSKFSDAGSISAAYRECMSWAIGEGIISGFEDGTLRPKTVATRAQVAVMLARFLANT